jgi:hypothetical protein
MHDRKTETSAKKPDLRDQPATSLRDSNVQSPVQDPQKENSSDPQRVPVRPRHRQARRRQLGDRADFAPIIPFR